MEHIKIKANPSMRADGDDRPSRRHLGAPPQRASCKFDSGHGRVGPIAGLIVCTGGDPLAKLAVNLLVYLRSLADRDGGAGEFRRWVVVLRTAHARKPSLLERLDRANIY
jgi:hypothetical protein